MGVPFVVVIEDDQTLGELFAMVLDLLPADHRLCTSAEEALTVLADTSCDVIVTDLLLPGLDGRGLLERLRAQPELQGSARVIVMSGSVDERVRRELLALGAWRVLAKPVTVKSLMACLKEAVEAGPEPATRAGLSAVEQHAVQEHFGGNEALFRSFRQLSLDQFGRDIARGDAALAAGDAVTLRHLAHNLKSVTRTLALEAAAQTARELERLAESASASAAASGPASDARAGGSVPGLSGSGPGASPQDLAALTPLWASLKSQLMQAMGAAG